MRIIIEIDGGEFVATPTALVSQKASTDVFTNAATIGAADAGPAPAGMINITMGTKEKEEENFIEPISSAKEMASDAGPSPQDLLSLAMTESQSEVLENIFSFAEAIDAGKPRKSILEEVRGGI